MRQRLKEYIFESKHRVNNQDVPVFSVTNDKGFIPSNDCFNKVVHSKDVANYKVVKPNFLCYNPSRINVGSIALNTTNQECAVSPMYVVFGCDTNNLLPEYLVLFLRSAVGLKTINAKTLGTVRFQLKFDYLKNIDVRIPDVQDQLKIVSLLEEIDDLRQKQRKAIELTRQMIPALFYEMFGKIDNPIYKLAPLAEAVLKSRKKTNPQNQ
jgi:type I restriction enzyme S subunit